MGPIGAFRAATRAASFALWTSGAVLSYRVLRRMRDHYNTWEGKRSLIQRWSYGVLPIFGLDVAVRGLPPDEPGPYLVVANHRSPLDILLSVHLVGGVFLSHDGVADIPVIGSAAKVNETIFVNQDDKHSGAAAMRQMRRRLTEGRNVIAFPEGNTFRGDEVRPFQPGVFAAARGLDHVKLLPLGLAYEAGAEYVDESFERHLFRMSAKPRTAVWGVIGEPMAVPRRGQEEAVRQVVQGLVDEAASARDAR